MVPFLLYKLILLFIFTMILGFAPAMTEEIKKYFDHVREENVLPCVIATSLFLIGKSHVQNLPQKNPHLLDTDKTFLFNYSRRSVFPTHSIQSLSKRPSRSHGTRERSDCRIQCGGSPRGTGNFDSLFALQQRNDQKTGTTSVCCLNSL